MESLGLIDALRHTSRLPNIHKKTYLRGCLSASACEAHSCKARGDDTCEVSCCAEDYCNKSTTQMVSGTMVFILSALAVLIGQMFY